MGGAAVEQQQELFPLGSLVEVKTDEEGFKGVFFVATVVPSTPLPKRKNGRKSFKKIHVEYQNLLASENGSDRLRESVDVSFVRPAPPPQEDFEGFGLNDSVDAFYKDGWWTGIIARVLEGGRFIVTFQNPPDELEFGLSELRVHWDWCDGSWFRPEKQGITGLMFEVGRKVEVSFDVEDFLGAWFPSTIDTVLTNGTYLVEYHSSNISNEDQFLKATVDYLHVRPCPPFLKDKSYVLLEKVDCFFNFGWWNGVITKVLEDCRYVVFFKQKNEEKEFHQSELRPHMDWKESKWFTSSSQLCEDFLLRSSEDEKLSPHASENTGANAVAVLQSGLGNNDCVKRTHCLLNLSENQIEPLIGSNEKYSLEKLPHQSCQNASGNILAVAASNPGNKVGSDQKTPCLLDLSENQIEPLVFTNKKSSHPAKLRSKRRWRLSEAHRVLSRPVKKLKKGNIPEGCEKVAPDRSAEEFLCSSGNDITVFTTQPSTMDQSSENIPQRELRKPQNLFGKDYSTSGISEKSRTPTLLLESSEPDCGVRSLGINFTGMEQDAVGNAAENALNKHAEKETELPIILGLPCAEIDTPGLGISRGKRGGYRSSSKKIWRPRSDQIRHSIVSAIEDTKNSKQIETGDFSHKRKRGRPRKELINNPHVLVTGNAKNGSVASSYICRKDGDLHNEVVMTDNNLAFNEPNDELADGSDPKNSNKSTKRTLSGVHNEQAMKESMKLAKSPSKRGGRHRVEDEQLSKWIEVMQTPTRNDSGKTMESNSLPETLESIDEVPCLELDEPLSKWIEGIRTPIVKDSVALENVDEVPFDELDEPLSKWIEVMQTPATIKYSGVLPVSPVEECVETNDNAVSIDGSEKQKKSGVQPRACDDTCATVASEQEDLPFAKNVVLWKTINSMDILQRIPQRPHFRPLIHLKESSREGLAIGYMVTFSRVVEKASSLQINDPKSITDEILETLEELEKFGFDVKVVEDCVGQMLEVKHKQEELREEVKGIGSQISHHNLEKQKIDEEIGEMRRQILMLQEKLSVAASVREKEESIIAPLQSKLQKVEEDIKIMELEFLNLAASL
ncbi:DUF724 domain-containing protein 7-like isoform X2 [Primulina tabacum]|uniref:DUF724 domain-containing protein 7-like isoform X2 n=1 Tax=Primulina tabacum TaxID=48773 RepID=UPI003F5990BF